MDKIQQPPKWKGYTLDELRFQSILTATRIELEKHRLIKSVEPYTNRHKAATSMMGKVAGALNFADYAIIAFTLGRRIFRLFRKR